MRVVKYSPEYWKERLPFIKALVNVDITQWRESLTKRPDK